MSQALDKRSKMGASSKADLPKADLSRDIMYE